MKFTPVFMKVEQGYIGFVPELPGANTQGGTLDETRANLEEAVELVLETNRAHWLEGALRTLFRRRNRLRHTPHNY